MRCIAIALGLAVFAGLGRTAYIVVKPEDPSGVQLTVQVQELPAKLVAAWKKAGAKVGWMSANPWNQFREGGRGRKAKCPPSISASGKSALWKACRNRQRPLDWTFSSRT